MIESVLVEILKKDVNIFLTEYSDFLSREQLEILRNIDYQNIISLVESTIPFGMVNMGKIYLTNSQDLMDSITKMDEFNTRKYQLNNTNMSSYLKYICENGYSLIDFYSDFLMYFVFQLVMRDNSGFINGLINHEIRLLAVKYSMRCANLYAREGRIVDRITSIISPEIIRKILFMDKVSRFKYLNDNLGLRYANLVETIEDLIEREYQSLKKDYSGVDGFLNYTMQYDNLSYGEVYNYLLDFEIENHLVA